MLPNGGRALIDPGKLTGYILNPAHPVGRNKARVFKAALGIGAGEADWLAAALLDAASTCEAVVERVDGFGTHYSIDFVLSLKGRVAPVRSFWVMRSGESDPRFVSAFVK